MLNKQLTKPQSQALLRHMKHHTEGHMLLMVKLVVDKHLTLAEAHPRAMAADGE